MLDSLHDLLEHGLNWETVGVGSTIRLVNWNVGGRINGRHGGCVDGNERRRLKWLHQYKYKLVLDGGKRPVLGQFHTF
jgi:hypothetical protein